MEKSVAAIAQLFLSSHPSCARHPTPPPKEIVYSSASSECTHNHPPASASSSSHNGSSVPHDTRSLSPTDQAQQFLRAIAQVKEQRLNLQVLKKETDFAAWKSVQVMKCYKNDRYKDLVELDDERMVIFKASPTRDESSSLFMLLYDALGFLHDKIVINAATTDGNELLHQIESFFIKKDTSVANKQTLKTEFDNMLGEQNESFDNFTIRYQKKIVQLQLNEVDVTMDDQTKAYKFLLALNSKILKTNICLEIPSKPEWYSNLALRSNCR